MIPFIYRTTSSTHADRNAALIMTPLGLPDATTHTSAEHDSSSSSTPPSRILRTYARRRVGVRVKPRAVSVISRSSSGSSDLPDPHTALVLSASPLVTSEAAVQEQAQKSVLAQVRNLPHKIDVICLTCRRRSWATPEQKLYVIHAMCLHRSLTGEWYIQAQSFVQPMNNNYPSKFTMCPYILRSVPS